MEVSKGRLKRCSIEGDKFEELFKQKIISNGLCFEKASNEDDFYKHIDCYVDGYGVDVKGNRHLQTIWLEYSNVNGNKGWLRGDAYYIAMHIAELNCFSIYNRVDLLEFVKLNVKEKTTNKNDYLKLYTREKWGKKDLITKVRYSDIKHLELKRI
tara:strand:- start:659 stop:1123 length:465 start_codon:yes stop_codon:yes gene_type:complete